MYVRSSLAASARVTADPNSNEAIAHQLVDCEFECFVASRCF